MSFIYPDDAVEQVKSESLRRVRSQIAKRIEKYCTNLSPQEFAALVDQMAGIQCKYEGARGAVPDLTDDTGSSPFR